MLLPCALLAAFALSVKAETIPLKQDGGTLLVPVRINGKITLDFIIDTGASDVSIPADVVSTLVRTGTITRTDLIGKQQYQMANGSTATARTIRIHSLRIGHIEIRGVVASIAPAQGPLLLGQSFLARLHSWAIDNRRDVLIIGTASEPADETSSADASESAEEAPAADTSEPAEEAPAAGASEPAEETPVGASEPANEAPLTGSFADQVASIQRVFLGSCGLDPTAEPASVCEPLSTLVAKAHSLLDQVQTGKLSQQAAEQQLNMAREQSSETGDVTDEVASIQHVFLAACGDDPTAEPISTCGPLATLVAKAKSLLNQVQAGALSPQEAKREIEAARDQAEHSP